MTEELASPENLDELAMAMGQIETRPEMTNLETDPPEKDKGDANMMNRSGGKANDDLEGGVWLTCTDWRSEW
ncbi:hypothetical protein SESBI_29304 [Sesbania bispinosa]|nr:hypothetical protein SESBI_29304 [Sesbania bispinosa]